MRTLVLGLAVMLGGCSITSMEARIEPQPHIPESSIGQGRTVAVRVVDERPSTDLGKRSSVGGTIKMEDDLAAIYRQALFDALKAKGFQPVGGPAPADATLKVELRGFSQVSTSGLWTMGSDIDAALKAFADAGTSHYEQFYRANAEHRTVAVSGAKALNAKLNAVINEQLETMFADKMLLSVLAGKTPTP